LPSIFGRERRVDILGGEFFAGGVGCALDNAGKLDLQAARQLEPVVGFEQIGDAAFARLRIDANDRFVGAADIVGVDGQIWHVP
jgi:hypothetical protein